jgi:hypothetical protein
MSTYDINRRQGSVRHGAANSAGKGKAGVQISAFGARCTRSSWFSWSSNKGLTLCSISQRMLSGRQDGSRSGKNHLKKKKKLKRGDQPKTRIREIREFYCESKDIL